MGSRECNQRSVNCPGNADRRYQLSTIRRQAADGLGFATRMRSEQSDEPSAEQLEEVDHFANATSLLSLCQPD
jgi:hypothetical protein